jgi:AhpD family alkylhydroperoxidase
MQSPTVDSVTATDAVWRLPGSLHSLRPDATRRLEVVNERVWDLLDPVLLELIRIRTAWLIGNSSGIRVRSAQALRAGRTEEKISELSAYPTSPRFTPFEREAVAFAEQFVMDVGGATGGLDGVAGHLADGQLREFVTAVYVVEFTQRLQVMAEGLLGSVPGPAETESAPPSSATVRELLAEYQDAVVRGKALDPVTTELVRLRCARTHHCRICQTLRLDDARTAGVDEPTTAKVDFYESSDLPERIKTALRITDAFITRPEVLADHHAEAARVMFSADELAELCLDITKWSTQKIHVALGTDSAEALPTDAEGVALFGFHDDGTVAGYWAGAPDEAAPRDPVR